MGEGEPTSLRLGMGVYEHEPGGRGEQQGCASSRLSFSARSCLLSSPSLHPRFSFLLLLRHSIHRPLDLPLALAFAFALRPRPSPLQLGSQDRATLGRAYSAGVSNVGVYAHPTSHGDISLSKLFFGISQTVSAPAVSVSAVTVDGELCLTVQYATPIWPEEEAEAYADNVARTLELAAAEATVQQSDAAKVPA